MSHRIENAYDAYWFLYEHPKLMAPERHPVTPEEADQMEAQGYLISRDAGGKCYRYMRHLQRRSLDENLEIFYAKTSTPGGHGRVDDDKSKNLYVECWLEFGSLAYGYAYSGNETPMAEWDTETTLHHYHDPDLDTGGTSFDEALVNLAKNVLEKYGDYNDENAVDGECGKPVCADCGQRREAVKKLGLE